MNKEILMAIIAFSALVGLILNMQSSLQTQMQTMEIRLTERISGVEMNLNERINVIDQRLFDLNGRMTQVGIPEQGQ